MIYKIVLNIVFYLVKTFKISIIANYIIVQKEYNPYDSVINENNVIGADRLYVKTKNVAMYGVTIIDYDDYIKNKKLKKYKKQQV